MGHGSYRASDWAKLKTSRGIHSSSDARSIFTSNKMDDRYNPKFINVRESCDSEDSPQATPIILGFDVTGSMGYLAEEIVKNALNKTLLHIYDKNPVTNPHVMCAAIGDVCDKAPLQVTQFEADIRILEQLMDLWLEMGGGDSPEDYNLLWYFADKHTRTDAFEKRHKKGFLFTIGDADVHPQISSADIKTIFGDETCDQTNPMLLEAVSQKYEVFHVVLYKSYPLASWEKLLHGHVVYLKNDHIGYLSEVITSVMYLVNGMSMEDVVKQWPQEIQPIIEQSISKINVNAEIPTSPQKQVPITKEASNPKKESFWRKLFGK